MNKVVMSGRLTKDIELKYTKNNTAVVSNSIAVQRNYKNADGSYTTDFINIEVWGSRAEYLSKYANKGDKVLISGRLQTDSYEKNGTRISTFNIIAEEIEILLTSKKQETNKEETKIETKKLADDVFEDFGNQIEIDESEMAF